MHALLERRLGYTIYCPCGDAEWAKHGITQPQHNSSYFSNSRREDGIFYKRVIRDNYDIRFITFEVFCEMDFDLVVVGNGRSEISFYNLAKRYKPNAIFIRQIGNLLEKPKKCTNVLLATKTPMPERVKWTRHYMEPPACFGYAPYEGDKTIKSYSNFLRRNAKTSSVWDRAKGMMPEYDFKMHGAKNDDGWIDLMDLADSMKSAMFIWHTKIAGGGGFTSQEALATGRPMIVNTHFSRAQNTRAQDYLKDGVNCIDLCSRPLEDAVKIVRRWSRPGIYEEKCVEGLKFYADHFNFEREARRIKKWLDKLRPVGKE